MDRAFFTDLFVQTIREPQAAARRLMALNLPNEVRVMGFVLVVILAALLAWLVQRLVPADAEAFGFFGGSPLRLAGMQAVAMVAIVIGMAFVPRRLGGLGEAEDALLLTVWLEAVLLVLQLAQVVLAFLFPFVALVLGMATFGLFFWLVVNFTAALHGFRNLGAVFLGVLGTLFFFAVILALVMGATGMVPVEAAHV